MTQDQNSTPVQSRDRAEERRVGSLILGALLMIAGGVLLMQRLDLMEVHPIGQLWPLALIAIGAGKIYLTWGTLQAGSGLWMFLSGIWFLAANFRIFGMTIQNSWPVLLLITGLTMIFKSYLSVRPPRGI